MKQTRLEKLNGDTTPMNERRKITPKELADECGKLCPVVIYSDENEWKGLFGEYTLIDATSISRDDLHGTDFNKHSFYYPRWLKDAEQTKCVVIINFAQVPVKTDNDYQISQYDFAHLLRDKNEYYASRELSMGSGIYVPLDLSVFLILRKGEKLDSFFHSRCAVIDLQDFKN